MEMEAEIEELLRDSFGTPNITNCTGDPGDVLGASPLTERMVVVVFLGVLTLITTLVNVGVIAAICTTRKLHLPANYLICSLAVTDFLVAVLVMPLSILYIARGTWSLGWVVCEAWLSLDMTCCTCSILHLCVIALDRYWAITKAIEYAPKRTARRAAVMVAAVWTLSVFISVPPLFWRRSRSPGTHTRCVIEHDHIGYTVYSTLGAFYIPMSLILILYYRIYSTAKTLYQKRGSSRHLSSRSTDSQNSVGHGHCRVAHTCMSAHHPAMEFDRLNAVARCPSFEAEAEAEAEGACEKSQICSARERKAARVLGLILGAFVLCWLPFFIKELLVGLRVLQPPPPVSDLLTWLGYINSLINPLLYTSFNEDFKLAFKKLFKCKEHV